MKHVVYTAVVFLELAVHLYVLVRLIFDHVKLGIIIMKTGHVKLPQYSVVGRDTFVYLIK